MGDVLRTTAILGKLHKPNTEITWVTKSESIALIKNSFVHKTLSYNDPQLVPMLMTKRYDKAYILDNDLEAAVLGAIVKAVKKYGYTMNKQGQIKALSKAAEEWLHISTNDVLKKNNVRTYQDYLFRLCDLTFDSRTDKMVCPTDWESSDILHVQDHMKKKQETWGLVIGAGARWPRKSIGQQRLEYIIEKLIKSNKQVLLIGGLAEEEKMKELVDKYKKKVISTGTHNSIRQLFHIVSLCNGLITPDSLTMHVGLALEIPVYTYIGPTSASELETYGVMQKLVPDLDCICCYLAHCQKQPACNEIFPIEEIEKKL